MPSSPAAVLLPQLAPRPAGSLGFCCFLLNELSTVQRCPFLGPLLCHEISWSYMRYDQGFLLSAEEAETLCYNLARRAR